jgi:hypothetical protein
MSSRTILAIVGAVLVAMGVGGLLNPGLILWWIGFQIATSSAPAYSLGEVRAVYGGLFAVIGIFTMISAIDPAANRGRLVALGCCWLGLGAGRLLGAMIDGDPGLWGWTFIVLELAAGALVVTLALFAGERGTRDLPEAAAAAPPAAAV